MYHSAITLMYGPNQVTPFYLKLGTIVPKRFLKNTTGAENAFEYPVSLNLTSAVAGVHSALRAWLYG